MNRFAAIVNSGYYLAVGGYKAVDKKFHNILNPDTGMYEPEAQYLTDDYLDLCISHQIDYNELSTKLFGQEPNTDLGQVEATYLAQSTNFDRAYKATSGAIIKETLLHLFNTGQIEAAIVIKKAGPLEYKPSKITTAAEVDELPPSVYHMIDYTDTVSLLEEATEKKLAVVGTPWQIDGLYQYIFSRNAKLQKKIHLTIGLLTGWYFSHHMIRALCAYYSINYDDLEDIVYRGGGRLGKTRFIFKDGSTKEINRFTIRSLVAFERYFNVPKFMVEINQHNMLADIVVGDAHIPECMYSKTGISLVISRSKVAEKTLRDMSEQKTITLKKVANETLIRSQKRDRLYGDFAYSYLDYLEEIGEPVPKIQAPNRAKHRSIPRSKLEKFHRSYQRKLALQKKGKYWQILIEKYTLNGHKVYPRLFKQVLGKVNQKSRPPIQENDLLDIFK